MASKIPPPRTRCDCKVVRQILNRPARIYPLRRVLFFSNQSQVCTHVYTLCMNENINVNTFRIYFSEIIFLIEQFKKYVQCVKSLSLSRYI